MKNATKTMLAALAMAGALALGTTSSRATVSASTNPNQTGSPGAQKTPDKADTEINRKILTNLLHADMDNLSDYRKVKIITVAGKVTLQGTLKSDKQKAILHAAAESVVGATNLKDQVVARN
jgi:osmotically-inducible protein OsmY